MENIRNSNNINNIIQSKDFMFVLYSSALSSQIVLLSDVLTKTIIIPIIDKHFFDGNLKQENFTSLYPENMNTTQNINTSLILNKNNIEFDIGKILYVLIRFIIIILLLVIFYNIFIYF